MQVGFTSTLSFTIHAHIVTTQIVTWASKGCQGNTGFPPHSRKSQEATVADYQGFEMQFIIIISICDDLWYFFSKEYVCEWGVRLKLCGIWKAISKCQHSARSNSTSVLLSLSFFWSFSPSSALTPRATKSSAKWKKWWLKLSVSKGATFWQKWLRNWIRMTENLGKTWRL